MSSVSRVAAVARDVPDNVAAVAAVNVIPGNSRPTSDVRVRDSDGGDLQPQDHYRRESIAEYRCTR
jgi:hypothetical protein